MTSMAEQYDSNSQNLNLENEEEFFTELLNKGIETLLFHLETKVDGEFANISKITFTNNNKVADVSLYVIQFKQFIKNHISTIHTHLSEVYLNIKYSTAILHNPIFYFLY